MVGEWKPAWGYQLRPAPWWAPGKLWLVSERIKHIRAQVDPFNLAQVKRLPIRQRIEAFKMVMGDAALIHHTMTGCPVCGSCFGAKSE